MTSNLGYYYKIARSQDDRAVEPNRIRKSIGAENSFAQDLSDPTSIMSELEQIAQILKERIDKHQSGGRTLTLKVKFSDYQQITRSRTLDVPIKDLSVIITEAKALFKSIELDNRNIRLLGLALSNLDNAQTSQIIQLSLFSF